MHVPHVNNGHDIIAFHVAVGRVSLGLARVEGIDARRADQDLHEWSDAYDVQVEERTVRSRKATATLWCVTLTEKSSEGAAFPRQVLEGLERIMEQW